MVKALIESRQFAVMVNVKRNGMMSLLAMQNELSFMDAGDYAIQAQGYFRYAILDHPDWESVEIEIGGIGGTLDLIEITRD